MCFLYVLFLDDVVDPYATAETPPPPATANTKPLVEAKQELQTQTPLPPKSAAHSVVATDAAEVQSSLVDDEQAFSSLPPAAASNSPPVCNIYTHTDKTYLETYIMMVIYSFCPFRLMHWTSAIWCWLQRELCGEAGSKAAVNEAERSVNNLKSGVLSG